MAQRETTDLRRSIANLKDEIFDITPFCLYANIPSAWTKRNILNAVIGT